MRRRDALLIGACTLAAVATPARARAAPREVLAELPGAALQGSGRLRFAGLRIYELRLWSAARVTAQNWTATPLALEIEYARTLAGPRIAERSLAEMRRQRELDAATAARWQRAMTTIFPDVHAGDRITGIKLPQATPAAARFFFNGSFAGEIAEAGFAPLFFGIWLAPQTSQAALRDALLGTGATRHDALPDTSAARHAAPPDERR